MRLIPMVLLLLAATSLCSGFFGRCAVVHVDAEELSTCYDFFAAVPALYFQEGGSSYASLLVTDGNDSQAGFYTMEDWALYLSQEGESGSLVFVGDVLPSFVTTVQGMVPYSETIEYTGTSFAIASEIALTEWPSTDEAVLCVYSDTDIEYLEGASAASAWAANCNCPVLWTDGAQLESSIENALESMGVSTVYLFDYPGAVTSDLTDALSAMSISVENFQEPSDVLSQTVLQSGKAVACVYLDEMQSLPAALAAARYGGYTLQLPESIDRLSSEAMAGIRTDFPHSFTKLLTPLPGLRSSGSEAIAEEFYNFLHSVSGASDDQLEFVLTFSDQTVFPATFERSISGDPSDPARDGAVPGRFPLEWVDNIGIINRGALYEAVIHANPRPDHVTLSMNAYEVQYWNTYTYSDNWYSDFVVNEMFGWPEEGWTAENGYFPGWPPSQPGLNPMWPESEDGNDTGNCPGQYATFLGEGYESEFHSGAGQGTGTHPAQPDVDLCGFVQDVNDGSVFLYFSCHGGGTVIAVRDEDNGIAQDNYSIEFQNPYWPDSDGRVYDGSAGGDYYETDLDEDFENLHSIIIAYNACDMANGEMNEIGLNHGAIGSIGSLTSVSFTGSGWWWNLWVHLVTAEDYTIGEASAYSNARVSTVYIPPSSPGADESLQYVLYGDPMVHFVSPDDTPPAPLPRKTAYGTHYPDGLPQGVEGEEYASEIGVIASNPARNSVSVQLSGAGMATLTVFELSGRVVSVPFQGELNGGHVLTVDTSALSPGMYFLRLEGVSGSQAPAIARIMVIE